MRREKHGVGQGKRVDPKSAKKFSSKNKGKRMNGKLTGKREFVFVILPIFFIGMIIYSSINIFEWWQDNNRNKSLLNEISSTVTVVEPEPNSEDEDVQEPSIEVDFQKLKETNSDTVAWLKVEGVRSSVSSCKNNKQYILLNA